MGAVIARAAILVWDVGQQPDMERLAEVVFELSGGRVHLHPVDTVTSDYAVVVADAHLDPQAVDGLWTRAQTERVDGIVEVPHTTPQRDLAKTFEISRAFGRQLRNPDFRAWLKSLGWTREWICPTLPDLPAVELWRQMAEPSGPDEPEGRRLVLIPDPDGVHGWRAMWVEVAK